MKTKLIFTICIIACFRFLCAQNNNRYESTPKRMQFVKQGSFDFVCDSTVKKITIAPFWMSNEITNKEFREFTDYIITNLSDSLQIALNDSFSDRKYILYEKINENLIDTLALAKEYPVNSENYNLLKKYFTDKKYDYYPVVGVSYYSAIYYCIWKTNVEKYKNSKINDYRLPSEEEWLYAANITNCNKINTNNEIRPSISGKKNRLKLYNFYSNVSEWTSKTLINNQLNLIKGASWKNEMYINERKFINKNAKSGCIGFRIVRTY